MRRGGEGVGQLMYHFVVSASSLAIMNSYVMIVFFLFVQKATIMLLELKRLLVSIQTHMKMKKDLVKKG